MDNKMKGIIPALAISFTKYGKVDVNQLEKIIEFEVIKLGIDGLYICGSTAKAFLLDFEEKN